MPIILSILFALLCLGAALIVAEWLSARKPRWPEELDTAPAGDEPGGDWDGR